MHIQDPAQGALVNIYVGNLPFDTSEEELQQIFAAFGEVATAAIIKDRYSGQSRGFGFVEMPNKEQGTAAIAGLNGKDFKGRMLNVNEARPREDRPRGGGFQRGGGSGGGRGERRDRGGERHDRW